jgi:hypothetical protein
MDLGILLSVVAVLVAGALTAVFHGRNKWGKD